MKLLEKGLGVYVHCTSGVFRSSSLVALYMITQMGMDLDSAVGVIVSKRGAARPNKEMIRVRDWCFFILRSLRRCKHSDL